MLSHRGGGGTPDQTTSLSLGCGEEEETDLETTTCSPCVHPQAPPIPMCSATQECRGRTVDDPGHPPQPEQNQQFKSLKLMLPEQENDVENKGNHDDNRVQDFKLVMEELQAENKYFKGNFYHKEGQDGNAHEVEHLKETRRHSESRSGLGQVTDHRPQVHLSGHQREFIH